MSPPLSIVTPTQGRPTLERMIASGRDQLLPGDEWLIVIDAHEMTTEAVHAVARRIGAACPGCRALSFDAGRHSFGHDQLNDGIEEARGDWLVFQDDDDVFTPGALDRIREAIASLPVPGPLLFRFEAYFGNRPIVWQRRGVIAPGTIGGHCLVVPNDPQRLGEFGPEHAGDFAFVRRTLDRWAPLEPVWVDAIITIQRPK